MAKRLRKVYGCPVEFTLDALGGKWKAVLLAHLKEQPLSYGDLRRRVGALSDKMLTERLQDLTAAGLVLQLPVEGQPGRYRYALSEQGQSLRPLLQMMFDWGTQHAPLLGVDIVPATHHPVR